MPAITFSRRGGSDQSWVRERTLSVVREFKKSMVAGRWAEVPIAWTPLKLAVCGINCTRRTCLGRLRMPKGFVEMGELFRGIRLLLLLLIRYLPLCVETAGCWFLPLLNWRGGKAGILGWWVLGSFVLSWRIGFPSRHYGAG